MFRVKICGVTGPEDAQLAVASGADAIGLNCYANSPRYLDPERADQTNSAIPGDVVKVGVFVNASAAEVRDSFDRLGLDLIQLHGDEPPAFLPLLKGRPVMRAFRCRDAGLSTVVDYLQKCRSLGCPPQMILLDAFYPGRYGGTGKVVDWAAIAGSLDQLGSAPLILAGGLDPQNVAQAIRTVRPHGVDAASGVESSPGVKDAARVCRFVTAARAALDEPE